MKKKNKKNAKNSFKEIEKEYVEFQKNQQSHCGGEHEKKAMLLEGDEISPGAANEEENEDYNDEELNNSKTLMDMEISSKLKKLMSSLKKSSGKQLKSEENLPSRKINSERIRFEKNFKHFLKKKKCFFVFEIKNLKFIFLLKKKGTHSCKEPQFLLKKDPLNLK